MHVTIRMAWHDHGWDGKICRDPGANTYCTGTHSLLSERLAREKRLGPELAAPGTNLDVALPEYLPPCFWSSCAFADDPTATLHRHPFGYLRDKKQIQAKLRPFSVYTWPFRLSITHDSFKRHGQYFPDLEKRIDRYCARLVKGKSLVFFYLTTITPSLQMITSTPWWAAVNFHTTRKLQDTFLSIRRSYRKSGAERA